MKHKNKQLKNTWPLRLNSQRIE